MRFLAIRLPLKMADVSLTFKFFHKYVTENTIFIGI